MKQSKAGEALALFKDAALEGLLKLSDEEVLREAGEDGDPIAAAAELRLQMLHLIAEERRARLMKAQKGLRSQTRPRPAPTPPLQDVRRLVLDAFRDQPSLGLAFREGTKQSDEDWQSLYEDLLIVGAIKPPDSDR